MSNKLELLSFIEFFESEPEWTHEMDWFYGARFITTRGSDTVIATVAPDEAEFSLEWRQANRTLIKFKLVMVTEWVFQTLDGQEQLFIKTTSDRETLCVITLKPEVAVNLEALW
ncbi:hypothetical protein IB234_23820, partial [Pseudomonas sp. PDM16]|uniref:hypothetical protein n=1 Tax=Pseudomonas sp. PDM16 TaxID=2769292 RepID=UPI0017815706